MVNSKTNILDGRKLSAELALKLKKEVATLPTKPKLVIIQVGDLESSNIYIKKKKSFGRKVGMSVLHKKYENNVSELEILADLDKFNLDKSVCGIMVQLPIPKNLDKSKILDSIDPRKDVDGLGSVNTKRLQENKEMFLPATTRGIITLLEHYKINIKGKKVVMVGNSTLVGKPTAQACRNRGARVVVCDINTVNLAEETKKADILITATGEKNLITPRHVREGQVVIDVGISIITKPKRKVVGDVDYKNVRKLVRYITPVPGGVGPMTVLSLFQNVLKAYFLNNHK